MISDKVTAVIVKYLTDAPFSWDEMAEELVEAGDPNYQQAADHLSSISVLAGTISSYLGYRGANGCGDSGHEKSKERALKKKKALRKANGYSYP